MKEQRSMSRTKKRNTISEEIALPYVTIEWSEKELETLAKLLTLEPAKPTEALVAAMRGSSKSDNPR
jgi:methylase of polypeptide subunit release factors